MMPDSELQEKILEVLNGDWHACHMWGTQGLSFIGVSGNIPYGDEEGIPFESRVSFMLEDMAKRGLIAVVEDPEEAFPYYTVKDKS